MKGTPDGLKKVWLCDSGLRLQDELSMSTNDATKMLTYKPPTDGFAVRRVTYPLLRDGSKGLE